MMIDVRTNQELIVLAGTEGFQKSFGVLLLSLALSMLILEYCIGQ